MIGSGVGGTAGAFYGFNRAMPIVRRWVKLKGPIWLHFFIGSPPVILFSSGCAGLAGGSIPALAQLASSYHAFVPPPMPPPSSSHVFEEHIVNAAISRSTSTVWEFKISLQKEVQPVCEEAVEVAIKLIP